MGYWELLTKILKTLWFLVILIVAIQAMISYRVILDQWELVEIPESIEYPVTIMFSYDVKEGFLMLYLKLFFPRGIKSGEYRVKLRLQDSEGRVVFIASYKSVAFQGEYVDNSFRVPLVQLNMSEKYELVVQVYYLGKIAITKRFSIKLF